MEKAVHNNLYRALCYLLHESHVTHHDRLHRRFNTGQTRIKISRNGEVREVRR